AVLRRSSPPEAHGEISLARQDARAFADKIFLMILVQQVRALEIEVQPVPRLPRTSQIELGVRGNVQVLQRGHITQRSVRGNVFGHLPVGPESRAVPWIVLLGRLGAIVGA